MGVILEYVNDNNALKLHQSPEQFATVCRSVKASDLLTSRQRQVFRLVERGHDTKTIARQMNLSPSTVKVHLASIYRTLQVASARQLLACLRDANWQPWVNDRRSGEFLAQR